MANSANRIQELVCDALSHGEMRHLALVVAVRRGLVGEPFKGDLARSVAVAVQGLIRVQAVAETDGTYKLTDQGRAERAERDHAHSAARSAAQVHRTDH